MEKNGKIMVLNGETEESPIDVRSLMRENLHKITLPPISLRAIRFLDSDALPEQTLELLTDCELLFLERGSVDFIINGEPFTLTEGHCFIGHPGTLRYRKETSSAISGLYIRYSSGAENDDFSESQASYTRFSNSPDVLATISYLRRIYDGNMPNQQRQFLATIQVLIVQLEDCIAFFSENENVSEIKKYIYQNYRSGIQLKDLAEAVDLHPVYCAKLFRRYEGISVGTFINRLRLSRAAAMLEQISLTSDVARDLGLSEYYFSRWFHQMTGMTPTEYRDAVKAGFAR